MGFALTEEQRLVIDKTIDNLFENGKPAFISGPAGSGKTTIASVIARKLLSKKMNVYFTAATHTAANKLERSLVNNGGCKIEVTTIHSFLKMRLARIEYGKQIYEFSEDFTFPENSVLVIDEGSMLSHEMYNFIEKYCFPNVIFLGDSSQIPPVSEDDSEKTRILSEYESRSPIETIDNDCKYELFTLHRQNSNSALGRLCAHIRKEILHGNGAKLYDEKYEFLEMLVKYRDEEDGTIIYDLPQNKVVEAILNNEDTCFLAFGNSTINAVQKHLPDWYRPGGFGILNGSISVENNGQTKMLLSNNQHISINTIQPKYIEKWGTTFDLLNVGKDIEMFCPTDIAAFNNTYKDWIQAALYNADKSNVFLQGRLKRDYHKHKYYSITNDNLNKFMCKVSTIREARVSTVHRAQGSQWQNVIIAFDNIRFAGKNLSGADDEHRKVIAMKLMYTAISRASETAIFTFGTKTANYTPV